MAINVQVKKVVWLSNQHNNGTLLASHGVIYLTEGDKNGELTLGTYTGYKPEEGFIKSYGAATRDRDNDLIARCVIVFDFDPSLHAGRSKDADETIRREIDRRFKLGLIPFGAYHDGNPSPSGVNREALVGYVHVRDFDTWLNIVKEVLGYRPMIDTRKPWVPRDAGTQYGQDLMVFEILDKYKTDSRAGFNGHTGLAKTMVALQVAHILYPTGGFILCTTPVIDTINDFLENLKTYRFGESRELVVRCYTKSDLAWKSIESMRQDADNGQLIFLMLSVQGIRRQDDPCNSTEDAVVGEKYVSLINNIDLWIRDEFHKEYGGPITAKAFEQLNPKRILDLTASLGKVIEQYSADQIVDRGLMWSLQYEKQRGTPHVIIACLGGVVQSSLPVALQDMYSEEEGWLPSKMVETMPNGQLKNLAAFESLFINAYCRDDDKDINPFTINNDYDLEPNERRFGLWKFPQGTGEMTASEYLSKATKGCMTNPIFKSNGVFLTTPWDIERMFTTDLNSAREVVDHLQKTHKVVAICTHEKYTVGSNIPQFGHAVLLDKMCDPYNFEQYFPGRCYRKHYYGAEIEANRKKSCKLYDLCPDHVVADLICNLATRTSSLNKTDPDPKKFLRCVGLGKYVAGLGWTYPTPEDIWGPYQARLREKNRPGVSEFNMIRILLDEGLVDDLTGLDLKNSALDPIDKMALTAANGAKGKEPNKKPKQPKGVKVSMSDARKIAQSINSIMLEIPAFAIPNNITDISSAIGFHMIRKMFDDKSIDLILSTMRTNRVFKDLLQEKLTGWHQAYLGLPPEESYDSIFINTTRKKKQGLVLINWAAAEEIVQKFISTNGLPVNTTDNILVINSLNGAIPLVLRKYLPHAKITCVEYFNYFMDSLRKLGFTVFLNSELENMKEMKFRAALLNPPYQKDTNFATDESNKQGSFWFQFVETAIDKLEPNGTLVVICPKSVFGAGGFNSKAFKVGALAKKISFTHIWPDLGDYFKVGIEILGFIARKTTVRSKVSIVGTNDTIKIDGTLPVAFYVSKTANNVLAKCFNTGDYTIGFSEKITPLPTDIVMRVNAGRYKIWEKTFVGVSTDTEHKQQGAIIKTEELAGYSSAIRSQLWEYLFKVLGGECGNSVTTIIDRMPIMEDMTVGYTDDEWYTAFGITATEQKNIALFLESNK